WTWRENQSLVRRLKKSKLSTEPCVEDINYRYPRKMDPSTMRGLTSSQWVTQHLNVLFTGPTGIGKSWLGQALAQKACRDGYSVLYRSSAKLLVDDFAMAALNDDERRSFLEICDDRYGRRSTILTSQIPVESWHAQIGDPTIADSILDRLVHSAYRIEMDGDSMRGNKNDAAPKSSGGRS